MFIIKNKFAALLDSALSGTARREFAYSLSEHVVLHTHTAKLMFGLNAMTTLSERKKLISRFWQSTGAKVFFAQKKPVNPMALIGNQIWRLKH